MSWDCEPTYLNFYHCDECDIEWEDAWTCMCNDKCPSCGCEIEPWASKAVVA